jgi:hypothetical protein
MRHPSADVRQGLGTSRFQLRRDSPMTSSYEEFGSGEFT